MKKMWIAAGLASCLMAAGCGSSTSTVPDSSEALMTIGKTSYSKGQVYELIKETDGPDMVISMALNIIYDREVPVTDEIEKEAKEQFETLSANYENIDKDLKEAGYASAEDYIKTVLVPSVQSEKLTEKYFLENKDAIINKYEPSISLILQTDSKEKAEDALKALKDGKSMEEAVKEYGSSTASYTGVEQTITSQNSTLPARLINSLALADKPGVIDEVFINDDESSYYVAVLVSNDFDENVDKYVAALSSDTDLAKQVVIAYLGKYNFEVHDQYIFDQLKQSNPEYLVTRPDLANQASSSN